MTAVTTAKVHDAEPGAALWDPELDDSGWLAVPVPGDLHLALAAHGRIPHPHQEPGDDAFLWMEDREWWYRLRLPAQPEAEEGERLRLVFHGVDTFATYWLDGVELGRSSNMFRPASFDVTGRVGKDSVVVVRIGRPLEQDRPEQGQVRLMRKAQFSYGWDFAPRRPGIGLWQPVELVRDRAAAVGLAGFRTVSLSAEQAVVEVDLTVERLVPDDLTVSVRLLSEGGEAAAVEQPLDGPVSLTVPDPRPWWTHDRGTPHLYDLEVTVRRGADEVLRVERRVGIRTVELDQSPDTDEPGTQFFRFRLNGEAIEARGANWVPCDTSLGAVAPGRRERLLAMAQAAHMTMLRIWGGGVYEDDSFYDTCDELGILVWQDLMFAGAEYPDHDEAWLRDVGDEIRHQRDRLSSHPCLALWCGNNEVELLAGAFGWGDPSPGRRVFHELAPELLQECGVPYLPTSPHHTNEHDRGDRHNWLVWHGVGEPGQDSSTVAWVRDERFVDPGSPEALQFVQDAGAHRYVEDRGRFVSEYGMGSAPALETLIRYGTTDLASVQARLRPPKLGPRNKLDLLLEASVGAPSDLRDFVELSQLMQAEGVKIGAEHYRRRWPHCGGSLIWQLDDCWPSLSWAMVDVDLRPKAAYYYARRFFSPYLASFAPTDDGCEVWVTNSTTDDLDDALVVRTLGFDGMVLSEATLDVRVPGSTSMPVGRVAAPPDPRSGYVSVVSRSGRVQGNRHFFAPIRELQRGTGEPQVVVDGPRVTVTGTAYHLLVHVVPEDPAVLLDDNVIDLAPGEVRTLTATAPGPLTVRWR